MRKKLQSSVTLCFNKRLSYREPPKSDYGLQVHRTTHGALLERGDHS